MHRINQRIGVFQLIILEQPLVEQDDKCCIVVRAGDLARREEHNAVHGKALICFLIPPGLGEIDAGHRVQVVQKPAVGKHGHVVARDERKVIIAVSGADVRIDLHKARSAARRIRLLDDLGDLDLVLLLHQTLALVLRVVECQ